MIKNKSHLLIAAAFVVALFLPTVAEAANLTRTSVRLGRLGISATSGNDLLVTFRLNTTPTSVSKIRVTFPSGFTLTAGTPTVGTTGFPNTPASITAPPGSLSAAVTSGGAGAGGTIVVSGLTSASLTNSTLYGFTIPSGSIQNPSSAAQYNTSVASLNSSDAVIDSSSAPTYVTGAGSNADQVTVNASVAPSFSFSLSANSDTIPAADPTGIFTSPTGVNMLVSTNSPFGYTAYVKSANAALTSATSSATPIATGTFDGTPESFTAGTTKYGFVPTTGAAASLFSGSSTYDAEYANTDATHGGAFNAAGTFASFVSRNGYTNNDTINLKERVTVGNTVGYANDYTDTLTIVAAGNY